MLARLRMAPTSLRALVSTALFAFTLVVASSVAAQSACVEAHEQAQHARMASRLLDARKQLLVCAQAECPRLIRGDCAGWLTEVESSLPTVVFAVSGSAGEDLVNVRVYSNGTLLTERTDGRAVAVDPGATSLRFEAEGHASLEQTITVRVAEKNRLLRVSMQRATHDAAATSPTSDGAKPRRLLISSLVLGGVAVGAAASALATGLRGKKLLDELERDCAPYCSDNDERPPQGRRLYIAADVTASIALATAVASVWTYVAHRRALHTHVTASATHSGGVLMLTRSF
jgi:hypothetical protein